MAVSKGVTPAVVLPRAGPAVQTIRASDVEPEELTFLWLDRVPHGTLTLVGGRPGMGKSLWTNYLAAVVTRAGGAVLMSNPEDAMATSKIPRLLAAGADPRLVHFWPGSKISIPDDIPFVEELVLFHGIQLVTIDPIAKHIRSKDPSTALEPLVAMAERTGVAIVGVHHLIKRLPKDAHPQEAFGGASGGWLGTTRVAHVFGPADGGEEESRFLAVAKANHTCDDAPSVEFYLEEVEVDLTNGKVQEVGRLVYVNDQSKTTPAGVVHFRGAGYKDAGGDPDKKAVAAEFLTLLLMNGPVPAKAIFDKAAEAGVSQKTCRRAADQLEIVKERVGFGPGSHLKWSLPLGHPALRSVGPKVSKSKKPKDGDVDAAIAKILGGEDDG